MVVLCNGYCRRISNWVAKGTREMGHGEREKISEKRQSAVTPKESVSRCQRSLGWAA